MSEDGAVRTERARRGRRIYARNFGVDEAAAEQLMTELGLAEAA